MLEHLGGYVLDAAQPEAEQAAEVASELGLENSAGGDRLSVDVADALRRVAATRYWLMARYETPLIPTRPVLQGRVPAHSTRS